MIAPVVIAMLAQYTFGETPSPAKPPDPCQTPATVDEAIQELAQNDELHGPEGLQDWLDAQERARQSRRTRGCGG